MARGEFQAALARLRPHLQSDSISTVRLLQIGNCYQNLMKLDSALIYLNRALDRDSSHLEALWSRANMLESSGNLPASCRDYERVLRIDRKRTSARIRLAMLYQQLAHYQESDSLLLELVQADSMNAFFFRQLGINALKQDNPARAIRYFRQAFSLNPQDLKVLHQLAALYLNQDSLQAARSVIDSGLSYYSDEITLLRLKGDVLYKMDSLRQAIPFYEKVIAHGIASPQLYKRLGMCYFFSNENTLAMLNLYKSYLMDSTDVITSYYLGLAYKSLELHQKALWYLQKAIQLSFPPFLSDLYVHLGFTYDHLNRYPEAIRSYREALHYDRRASLPYFYLAAAYDAFYADRRVAYFYYKKYLQLSAAQGGGDPKLAAYAEKRISSLKEEMHLRGQSFSNR